MDVGWATVPHPANCAGRHAGSNRRLPRSTGSVVVNPFTFLTIVVTILAIGAALVGTSQGPPPPPEKREPRNRGIFKSD